MQVESQKVGMVLQLNISIRVLKSQYCLETLLSETLGKPSREKSAVFFNIVQKAFDPPLVSCPTRWYLVGGGDPI